MPFEETHVVDERTRFIEEVHRSGRSFTAICDRYGISRTTGYEWLKRWKVAGPEGLRDRSSRPKSCPWATPPEVVDAILGVRRSYDDFGPKKIIWYLERHRPELALPSRQTVYNILLRHDAVPRRRRRVRRWHPGRPDSDATEPNETWSTDFKGEFPMGDGQLCYPLTVQDMHSRCVLEVRGRPDVTLDGVMPVFKRLFQRYGLPERIRSDNGTPFASNALGRLSRLSVWFIQLGILPELIEPASPHQNGKHENMHLVLKRRTTRPPRANMRAQQRAFRTSALTTTPCALMKPSTAPCLPTSTNHPLGPFPADSSPSPTPATSRLDSSARTVASDGTATASPSAASSPVTKSVSKKLTTASSTSTSVPSG